MIHKQNPNPKHLLNQSGQGLTEYLILLVLIAVTSIGIVTKMGSTIQSKMEDAKEKIRSISINPVK